MEIQDGLQTLYTSGTVFHAFLGEKLSDWKSAARLVKKIAEKYTLPYYTLSPTYSICQEHGYLAGEKYACPHCAKKTEVYSRITGYYRPVQNWNDGKAQEFKNRKVYNIASSDHADKPYCAASYSDGNAAADYKDSATAVSKAFGVRQNLLFTTKTCPNCKVAQKLLTDAGVQFMLVDADENEELVIKYGVRQAPTLISVTGGDFKRYANVSSISQFIEEPAERA